MVENIQETAWEDRKDMTVIIFWALALLVGCFWGSRAANAQQFNQAWSFTSQNRASIAALMQQVENGDGNGAAIAASPSYDSLVCGGGGASTATGNSTCIILNKSDGLIQIGQDANGNQEATNTQTGSASGLSDVLESVSSQTN